MVQIGFQQSLKVSRASGRREHRLGEKKHVFFVCSLGRFCLVGAEINGRF